MINQTIKFEIISNLKKLPVYIPNPSGTQHVVRCQYCGDSRNPAHGHFSIHIDTESETPMMYRCFKCDNGGLLNDEVLEDLGIYLDKDSKSSLSMFNKKIRKKYRLVNTEIENFSVPFYHSNYNNQLKLDYLNRRLDVDIDFEMAKNLKIVINLFDFLTLNELKSIPNISYGQLKLLNNNYVGFLSTNNNCITFRNITNNNKLMRYYKMILNPSNINKNTFYSIPNSINLMYTNDIDIHISEGILDILSIYMNLIKSTENNLYYASCGFGVKSILRYLVHTGINTGLNIHNYSDKDKTDKDHRKNIFSQSSVYHWTDHIYIHRNQFNGEKDYGVPSNRIIDSKRRIK